MSNTEDGQIAPQIVCNFPEEESSSQSWDATEAASMRSNSSTEDSHVLPNSTDEPLWVKAFRDQKQPKGKKKKKKQNYSRMQLRGRRSYNKEQKESSQGLSTSQSNLMKEKPNASGEEGEQSCATQDLFGVELSGTLVNKEIEVEPVAGTSSCPQSCPAQTDSAKTALVTLSLNRIEKTIARRIERDRKKHCVIKEKLLLLKNTLKSKSLLNNERFFKRTLRSQLKHYLTPHTAISHNRPYQTTSLPLKENRVQQSAVQQPNAKHSQRRELQLVVLSEDGVRLTEDEANTLREDLIESIIEATLDSEGNPIGPELRFYRTGLIEEGWFLITCLTEETRDWALKWKPKIKDGLKVVSYIDAPWPVKIGFWVKAQELDLQKLTVLLRAQNRAAKVETWKHITACGDSNINWYITFAVSPEIANHLAREGMILAYEATVLKVNILSSRGLTLADQSDKALI